MNIRGTIVTRFGPRKIWREERGSWLPTGGRGEGRGGREAFSCPAARNAICIHKRISRRAYKACKNTLVHSSDLIFVRLLISPPGSRLVSPHSRLISRRFIIVIHACLAYLRVEHHQRPRSNFQEFARSIRVSSSSSSPLDYWILLLRCESGEKREGKKDVSKSKFFPWFK